MSFWSLTLIGTGVLCIVVSFLNARHAPTNTNYIAIHKGMDDERIRSQLKRGPWRVDATLGIQFGAALIVLGLLAELTRFVYWF